MREQVEAADPVAIVTKALGKLQESNQKISKKNLLKVTPYTSIQLAGIIGRDYGLEELFNKLRAAQ